MSHILGLARLLDELDDEAFLIAAGQALGVLAGGADSDALVLLDLIGPRLDEVLSAPGR